MDFADLLTRTLEGLGFELVDLELANRGKLVRVFMDKPGGINVEDCATVSNHLTRLFAAEGVDFDRLEVSSPGLDRPLKRAADFRRFAGERVQLKLRLPKDGRRNFAGTLTSAGDDGIELDVEGQPVRIGYADIDKARLVPDI